MTRKVGGYLILLVSAALALLTVAAFMRTTEMASSLALLAPAYGLALDPADWGFRWRITSVVLLVLAGGGIVAGVGILRGRRWGLLVWCLTITILLLGQGVSNLTARYAFEQTPIVEGLVTLLVCATSWVVWWRARTVRREVEQ